MRPLSIISIVGARPQFIKLVSIARALSVSETWGVEVIHKVIHTGQHYDDRMSSAFLGQLGFPHVHRNLDVGSGPHGKQTGNMMLRIEAVLSDEPPAVVLVYGDTNSTLAGALAAAKLHIPVAHVEAGLRSHKMKMPEEINRVLTDRVSTLMFCPTATAVENLRREGFGSLIQGGKLLPPSCEGFPRPGTIDSPWTVNVGDVMYDAVLQHVERAKKQSRIRESLGLSGEDYALMTVHRAENTDDESRLEAILSAASTLAEDDLPVVFPVHPRTQKALTALGTKESSQRLRLIDPVPYLDMLALEAQAKLILTDSGGVQKEAFFLAVPCVTFREETEWTELVRVGWNRLAGANAGSILEEARRLLRTPPSAIPPGLYGDGHAAERIIHVCRAWWDHECP